MANETEKLTVNLGVVELAQIDVLVNQGFYSNRSDFIRTAVRNCLENDKDKIEQQFLPVSNKKNRLNIIGIHVISKKSLENFAKNNEMLNINVIGMIVVDKNVGAELFKKAVEHVVIHGKLAAPDEIKDIVAQMN